MVQAGVANFFTCDTRPFFLTSSQEEPTPENLRKLSGIFTESSFNHDSKYVIKSVVSPIQKQKQSERVNPDLLLSGNLLFGLPNFL